MIDRTAIRLFLETLYGDDGVNEEHRLVLWSPGKAANDWCTSIADGVERITARGADSDVYFVACLHSLEAMREEAGRRKESPDPARRRGYEQSAAVLPALWLDLDYGTEGHQKTGLPPTEADALSIVDGMPAPPTMVVRTGGGVHAWWALLDPLELSNAEDRARARALTYGWSLIARGLCEKRGWSMDSVWDLARVMRVPGTLNRKTEYGEPRPVEIDRIEPDTRHDVEGLEVFLPADSPPPAAAAAKVTTDEFKFILDPNATPDADALMTLCDLDAEFKRTWERERKDLPSQSEYDLALATRLSDVGWGDQQIVDALIAHRRKHGQPAKLRHDYYGARLAIVRKQNPGISEGLESLTELGEEIRAGIEVAEDRLGEIKGHLTKLMALPTGSAIVRIEKYEGDPPTFSLLTEVGRITLGPVANITNPTLFRNAVASATGHLIKRFKGPAWDKVAQAILHAAQLVDLGEEVSVEGEVVGWLRGYLEDEPPEQDHNDGCESRVPFVHQGQVFIVLQSFRSWLRMSLDVRIEARVLARRLREAGSKNIRVSYRKAESKENSSRSCYLVPQLSRSSKAAPTAGEPVGPGSPGGVE